ncbi:MAG: phage tail sheath subtilisin-like domain-containing protein [Cyanobacteria bacterium J06631_9]
MPVDPIYPGVYVEELPSGVRTITGVATSITAFIGRALRGPIDEPITINNYGDFERAFGGLWRNSSLGYAVQDFYLNGGEQAIVVRLFHQEQKTKLDDDGKPVVEKDPNGGPILVPATATLEASGPAIDADSEATPPVVAVKKGSLTLAAASPGSWGNHLRARVEYASISGLGERYGLADSDLFNLIVRDTRTGVTETFQNVSVVDSARRVDEVLESESMLVRFDGTLPETRPTPHKPPEPGKSIWEDSAAEEGEASSSKVKTAVADGVAIDQSDFTGEGTAAAKKGLYALEKVDLFNLLCIPPYKGDDVDSDLMTKSAVYCEKRRAMLLVDAPSSWTKVADARDGVGDVGTNSKNAAVFFPRLRKPDPLRENQIGTFVPCGAIAGIMARTDAQQGVWKAPAGLDATISGVTAFSVPLTDDENDQLNPLGINCLRAFPTAGLVVWGARTLQGNDQLASEGKYIPVRRLALFLEESLYRGTQWVVFEPNDESLWAQIRLNIGAFMNNLFQQGALQGSSPKEAYFVKCDKETTTQNDINQGIVNIVVGYAPLKPAEFVILKFQKIVGEIAT